MKRLFGFVIAALVVGLVMSGTVSAGSVTSRYDVTIGGYIFLETQYATQNSSTQKNIADRESGRVLKNFNDEFDSVEWNYETRLNFLVKGPDAFGAKTSAFLEFDFLGRGDDNQGQSWGTPGIRHAYMALDWPNTRVILGQGWQPWGYQLPPFAVLSTFGTNDAGFKGTRRPQISIDQKFGGGFDATFAIEQNEGADKGGTSNTGWNPLPSQRALWPETSLSLRWQTDSCGRIGPAPLTFYVAGAWAQRLQTQSPLGTTVPTAAQQPVATSGITSTKFFSEKVDGYWAIGGTFIPIIPEKKPGSKAGSLGFSALAYYGQNASFFYGFGAGPYATPAAGDADAVRNPKSYAVIGQLGYWWADKWSSFVNYNYGKKMYSDVRENAANEAIDHHQFIANIVYDPTPSLRFILQGSQVRDDYGSRVTVGGNSLKNHGTNYLWVFSAHYFF